MKLEQQQALQGHIEEIAKLLYEEVEEENPEALTSLGKIEAVVRSEMQKHVLPKVGFFLSKA